MFGSLSPERFLAEHWQRAPLLIRGALPELVSPITPDELAGLACEAEVEARLVQGRVGGTWRLEHGPFDAKRFGTLPERDWTLLVQDVDKLVPELAGLLGAYRCLPDWRIDDIMVSYAAPGGSVGPHTDQYDVFLVQALGRRRWQLAERFDPALVPDADLKILEHFVPEQEFVVEPGDVLYLPPKVAHFGLALDEAMTFSVGFRAPDQRELMAGFAEELILRATPELRFEDAGRPLAEDPSILLEADLSRFRQLIRSALSASDADLDSFIGRYLTRSKPHLEVEERKTEAAQLERRLKRGQKLRRRIGTRFVQVEREAQVWLFADGREFRLDPEHQDWITTLARGEAIGSEVVQADRSALPVLFSLFRQGTLEWL